MRNLLLVTIFISSMQTWAAIKIASYNIRNFDYDERAQIPTDKNFLYDTISQIDPDFMAIQEINEKQKFEQFISSRFNNRYSVSLTTCGGAHGQKLGFVYDKSKFTAIGFKDDLRTSNPNQQSQAWCNEGSRPLAVGKYLIKATGETMIAISVHLKSGGRPKSIQKRFKQIGIIGKVVAEHRAQGYKNFVIMGDFNSTEYIFKGKNHNKFKMHVHKMGMQDLAADLPCTAYWWGAKDDNKQYPSMLDHILVSNEFLNKNSVAQVKLQPKAQPKATTTTHCKVLSCKVTWEGELGTSFDSVSDHCPLNTEI
jgi:endonuclease/exonuclease/phosphatase family metal-dependent hydrolase